MAGRNWTAWNAVRANALTKRPRDVPRMASAIASRITPHLVSDMWGLSSQRRRPTRQAGTASQEPQNFGEVDEVLANGSNRCRRTAPA